MAVGVPGHARRDPARQRLTLKCFDEDALKEDDALGFSMVPVQALCDGVRHELQLQLQGAGARGTVQLSVHYAPFTGGAPNLPLSWGPGKVTEDDVAAVGCGRRGTCCHKREDLCDSSTSWAANYSVLR